MTSTIYKQFHQLQPQDRESPIIGNVPITSISGQPQPSAFLPTKAVQQMPEMMPHGYLGNSAVLHPSVGGSVSSEVLRQLFDPNNAAQHSNQSLSEIISRNQSHLIQYLIANSHGGQQLKQMQQSLAQQQQQMFLPHHQIGQQHNNIFEHEK
jgi:hypothetical protein